MNRFSVVKHYAAMQPLIALTQQVEAAGRLEPALVQLVLMRVSQINGCAYCLDMHSRDARKGGETEQRLYVLSAWEESPAFTDRERAALRWTECLTRLPSEGAPDDVYAALEAQFSQPEIANLTVLIGMINLWNRIAISSH